MAFDAIRYQPDVLPAGSVWGEGYVPGQQASSGAGAGGCSVGAGWDLTALDEHLLAQMAANKPLLIRAMFVLSRVDEWITSLVNGRRR